MASAIDGDTIPVSAYILPSDQNSVCDFKAALSLTVGGLRTMVQQEAKNFLGGKGEPLAKEIIITSDKSGSDVFENDELQLKSITNSSRLYALVPTQPINLPKAGSSRQEKLEAMKAKMANAVQNTIEGQKSNTMALLKHVDKQRNAERGRLTDEIEEMKREMRKSMMDMKSSVDQVKAENVELRKENVELRKENVELRKEIGQLKKRTTTLENLNSVLTSERGDLKGIIANLKRDKQQSDDWIKNQDIKIKGLQDENRKLELRVKGLEEDNKKVKDDLQKQVKLQEDLRVQDDVNLRNLLDQAQTLLARAAKLSTNPTEKSLSLTWRKKLGDDNTDDQRREVAKTLFKGRPDLDVGVAAEVIKFLESSGGELVTQRFSVLRDRGNDAAHGLLNEDNVWFAIDRLPITGRESAVSLYNFVDKISALKL